MLEPVGVADLENQRRSVLLGERPGESPDDRFGVLPLDRAVGVEDVEEDEAVILESYLGFVAAAGRSYVSRTQGTGRTGRHRQRSRLSAAKRESAQTWSKSP